jgi:hypothetical protein
MRVEREWGRSRAVVGTPSFGCDMHRSNVAWPRENTKSAKTNLCAPCVPSRQLSCFCPPVFLSKVLRSIFSLRTSIFWLLPSPSGKGSERGPFPRLYTPVVWCQQVTGGVRCPPHGCWNATFCHSLQHFFSALRLFSGHFGSPRGSTFSRGNCHVSPQSVDSDFWLLTSLFFAPAIIPGSKQLSTVLCYSCRDVGRNPLRRNGLRPRK